MDLQGCHLFKQDTEGQAGLDRERYLGSRDGSDFGSKLGGMAGTLKQMEEEARKQIMTLFVAGSLTWRWVGQ